MLNYVLAKEDLLSAVAQIQEKKDLSGHVGADYYEPGKMEKDYQPRDPRHICIKRSSHSDRPRRNL